MLAALADHGVVPAPAEAIAGSAGVPSRLGAALLDLPAGAACVRMLAAAGLAFAPIRSGRRRR